jgi:hypothetical protein
VGLAAFALALGRPEGFVYLAPVAFVGAIEKRSAGWWMRAVAAPAMAVAILSAVRWLAFGSPVPLPVLAKIGRVDYWHRLQSGAEYIAAFGRASVIGAILLVMAGAALVLTSSDLMSRSRGKDRRFMLAPVAVLTTHLVMVLLVGGDWMAYTRFIAPVIPLLAIVTMQVFVSCLSVVCPRSAVAVGATVAFAIAVSLASNEKTGLHYPFIKSTCLQRSGDDLANESLGSSLGQRVRRLNYPFRRDESQLLPFLLGPLRALSENRVVTIASCQMGYLPYHVRAFGLHNVRFVDTVGLVDPALARLPGPRTTWGLAIGNDVTLLMDPASGDPVARAVQDRNPDLVYMLSTDEKAVRQMEQWHWTLVWDAPQAKIFARNTLRSSMTLPLTPAAR